MSLRANVVTLLVGTLTLSPSFGVAERVVLEAVMVRVNERVVTITDFQRRLQQELGQVAARPYGDDLRDFAEGLFETVVNEMVMLERAEEKRLTIEDDMVEDAITSLREENNLEDDAAFERALASAGMTLEELKSRYRQNMLLQRAVQSEIQPTEITQEEIRRIYEQEKESFQVPPKVRVEQLFFPVADDESDREDVLRRVRGLVSRVRQGSDLTAEATLAGIEVQELGAVPEADLRSDLRAALDALEHGDLTDPLSVAGGFQVVHLVERVPAGYQPFEEVKERLRRRLSQQSYGDQTNGLVAKLRQDYLVEIHNELLDVALQGLGDG
jgi:parvulin-like peptidyl-prolyl isomerase